MNIFVTVHQSFERRSAALRNGSQEVGHESMVRSRTAGTGARIAKALRTFVVPFAWAVAIGVYAALVHGGLVRGRGAIWLSDLAWTAAALIATLATLRAALPLQGSRRSAWMLFAAACALWLLGQLAWDWQRLVRGAALPFPSVADLGYTGFGILMIVGLMRMRATQPPATLDPRRLANLGLLICTLLVVLIAMVLEPLLRTDRPPFFVAVALLEGISVTAAFVVAMYFMWSFRWGADLLPLVLITASLTVHAAAGLIYANNLVADRFGPGSLVNVAWFIAFAFQHWAASERQRSQPDASVASQARIQDWVEAVVPAFLLLVIAVTTVTFIDHLSARAVVINSVLLALFAALLAFRETWLYRRELHLQSRLQRSHTQLDAAREQLRQAAGGLTELERNTRFSARAGGVGLWDWDLRTNKVDYSPEWKRQLGYDEDELGPDPQEWRSRIHPDDLEAATVSLQQFLRELPGEYTAEMRLRHRDGSYRWILARARVHLDKHGAPSRLLGAHLDITERKRIEMALRDSEARYRELTAELERRVAERTADVHEAYREAQNQAYALAHDLRAPLRAIDSFSHLLQESSRGKLDALEETYVLRVRRSALQMAALIEGLLAYSHIEHRPMCLSTLDLADFAARIVGERREEITARALHLELAVPRGLTVRADREGLAVVLRNLLDNSLKFTAPTAEARIEIGARRTASSVVLWVTDNGIGFDECYRERIFEIFQRLHRSDEFGGTGIGLALARKAVQRMRGRIWAESASGAGASFYVELPLD